MFVTRRKHLIFLLQKKKDRRYYISKCNIFNPEDGQHYEDIYVSYRDIKTNDGPLQN